MNHFITALIIAIAVTACGGSHRTARFADTPDGRSSSICQADSLNNSNCVERINTQDKYDDCVSDHNGDVGICDYIYRRGAYALIGHGGYAVPLAPPGPNAWGTAAGPVHAGYGWEAGVAQSQSQGSSDGSSVPRSEYEQDKKVNTRHLHHLYEQVNTDTERLNRLEGGDESSK